MWKVGGWEEGKVGGGSQVGKGVEEEGRGILLEYNISSQVVVHL